MIIVVHGAKATQLYPVVGKYGGHAGYQFGNRWYMVAVAQQHRGDDFDLYWNEPSAMDAEFGMPYGHLGHWQWLSLQIR